MPEDNINIEIRDDNYTDDIMRKAKKKKFHIFKGDDKRLNVPKIPFDIPQLDRVLGGGLPLGRTILVVGNSSAGKTFFSQLALANFQRRGLTTAYVDTERRYEPLWFGNSGIDINKLFVAQPDSGENALDICEFLVAEKFGLVVLDSIAALIPMAEVEGTMEDSTIASLARLFNKGLRKVTRENIADEDLTYRGTAFIAINQIRSGIGLYTSYALPGGQGQQFFASIILRVMRGSYIDIDKKRIGFNMKFHTDKNNLAEPLQECSLPFHFTGIIDTIGGLVELAIEIGVIKQTGAYYYFPWQEEKKIQGKQAVIEHLKEDLNLFNEVKERIYQVE